MLRPRRSAAASTASTARQAYEAGNQRRFGSPARWRPSSVPSRGGDWEDRPRSPDIIEFERQIAELVDRSTQDLRVAWRELHRTGPPLGLSRDLLIRALAHRLQEQTHGGTSRAQRRRLQTLAREFEKGSGSLDPGIVLRTGATLVRQWRGHTHSVLVRGDGFEYDGRHYRSLTGQRRPRSRVTRPQSGPLSTPTSED